MSHGRYSSYSGAGSSYGASGSSYSTSGGSSYTGSSYGTSGSKYGAGSSYSSTSGYGGGGSSSYKSYDYPSSLSPRTSTSGYGLTGGSGGGYRSSIGDRGLGYASTSGAVSSLKGRFDPASSSYSTRDTPGGGSAYPSSSLDRYSSRLNGSGLSDYSSKLGSSSSSYSTDLNQSGGGARSYGSSSSSSYSGATGRSYPSSSYTSSRTDTARSGSSSSRDYGSSYASPASNSSSTSAAALAKSTSYSLTPFESRRPATSRSTDLNLTPFTSRTSVTADSSVTSAAAEVVASSLPLRTNSDRQTNSSDIVSEKPSTHPSSSTAAAGKKRSESDDATSRQRTTRRSILSSSSDSAEEPGPGRRRDPDVRYLTSRATSPMEIDSDAVDTTKAELKAKRNRLIARTKTKTYPVLDRRRKRQLKNVQLQVDLTELDKFAGRVCLNKEKPLTPSNIKQEIKRYGLTTVTKPPESFAGDKSLSSSSIPLKSVTAELTPVPVVLPKQSGFIPKNRRSSEVEDVLPDKDSSWIKKTAAAKEKESSTKEVKASTEPAAPPKQSSFLERRRQQKEEEAKKKLEEVNKNIAAAAAALKETTTAAKDNMTLKESIDKVRSWKKQMQQLEATSAEPANPIFADSDDWRKKKPSTDVRLQHPSHRDKASPPKQLNPTTVAQRTIPLSTSPPSTVRSHSESDRSSEVGFSCDASPNLSAARAVRTVGGVTRIERGGAKNSTATKESSDSEESSSDSSESSDSSSDDSKTKKDSGTTTSAKNQKNSITTDPETWNGMEMMKDFDHNVSVNGKTNEVAKSSAKDEPTKTLTGKPPTGAPNKAFPSTESLGGFGSDVSADSDSDDERKKKKVPTATLR